MQLLLSLLYLLFALTVHAGIIALPRGVQAEGVTHATGTKYFFADIRSGDIYVADVETRLVTRTVIAPQNRTAIGIYSRRGRLFAAGGGGGIFSVPSLHVYGVATGKTIASCAVDGGLVNDVVADREFAYYTDTILGRLYKLSIEALPKCEVETIELPKPLFDFEENGASANGLVTYKEGLVVVHGDLGTIFFVDLINRNKVQAILPPGSIPRADGIDIDRKKGGSLLFVAQRSINQVSMWRLGIDDERKVSAVLLKNITSSGFGHPTSVGVSEEYIVAANPRFDTVPFTDPVPENVTLSLLAIRRNL